jgi:hypothetical protein
MSGNQTNKLRGNFRKVVEISLAADVQRADFREEVSNTYVNHFADRLRSLKFIPVRDLLGN